MPFSLSIKLQFILKSQLLRFDKNSTFPKKEHSTNLDKSSTKLVTVNGQIKQVLFNKFSC